MNSLMWLLSKIVQFLFGSGGKRRSTSMGKEDEAGGFESQTATRSRNFDDDYRAATKILKMRMDARFPDNFHARMGSETNSMRDFGDERAGAIDTASAAIAAALRNGATVKQAADAGAASVGLRVASGR
ncbi:hypothetical protein [Methylobacterium sp. PvR107]|uniref:hypothetical protein n=1 Tax=Methylobacterium sp. PvR107 TaxID=2806597 RepID=UPI001AE8170D|nr:hypothetical protein [Methylobacterium sp. PvR107]MBP1180969.1 hypothetical protein [Methylobacterium sp. PvR107]